MIAQLRGRLASKEPHRVVVDVGGVGYLVLIPLSTFYRLPEVPAEVMLHTFTHVREDAIQLFGFHTRDEQTLFELRNKHSTGVLDSTADLSKTKREIARILTVAREKEIASAQAKE